MRATGTSRGRSPWTAVLLAGTFAVAACGGGGDDDAGPSAEATTEPSTDVAESEGPTSEETPAEPSVSADLSADAPVVATIAPEEPNVDPVAGGVLRYATDADSDGLNPTSSRFAPSGATMASAVFDNVAAVAADGTIVPYLAESFTPSADFTSWTMKLRDGISFHDDTPLNADAVLANFEAQVADPLVGIAVRPFFPETGAIAKVDDLTVQFNLIDANAYFPAFLVGQLGMVASPTWLEAALADPTLNQEPVGTGPFKFDARSEDSVTRLVRNDEWWGGEVYLDAIEIYPVPDAATRIDLMLGGELEGLMTNDPEALIGLDTEGINNVLDETGEEQFAMVNTEVPPFNDIRARRALTLATPLQDYLDLIGLGIHRQANGRFIAESPYFNPDVVQEGDDPDAAVALAADYCAERGADTNPILNTPVCTDGKINIELQYSGPSILQDRIHELLESSWSVAFNVTFDELLEDEHIQQTAFGQYNANTWRQFGGEDAAVDNIWLLCRTVGGISLNFPRYCDEDRDALLLEAQATTDPARRAELYQQVEQMIHDAYTYIFLRHTIWDNAFIDSVNGVCDRTSPEGVQLKCTINGRAWFTTMWLTP